MIRQKVKTKKTLTFHSFILFIIFLMMTVFIQNCSLPFVSDRKPAWHPGQQTPPDTQPASQKTGAYASLNIKTEPPGCHVYLDDRMVGLSPLKLEHLEPKRFTVRLILTGYKDRERSVVLYRGKEKSIDVLMEVVEDTKMETSPDSE